MHQEISKTSIPMPRFSGLAFALFGNPGCQFFQKTSMLVASLAGEGCLPEGSVGITGDCLFHQKARLLVTCDRGARQCRGMQRASAVKKTFAPSDPSLRSQQPEKPTGHQGTPSQVGGGHLQKRHIHCLLNIHSSIPNPNPISHERGVRDALAQAPMWRDQEASVAAQTVAAQVSTAGVAGNTGLHPTQVAPPPPAKIEEKNPGHQKDGKR